MLNVYYCLGPVHLQFKNVYISAGADVGQVVTGWHLYDKERSLVMLRPYLDIFTCIPLLTRLPAKAGKV